MNYILTMSHSCCAMHLAPDKMCNLLFEGHYVKVMSFAFSNNESYGEIYSAFNCKMVLLSRLQLS